MKLIFLYHPNYKEAKRVDIDREDGPADEARLTAQGWSRKRFAQIVYHPKHGSKLLRTPEEVTAALKQGWLDKPITDAVKGEKAHPDSVHPHPRPVEDKPHADSLAEMTARRAELERLIAAEQAKVKTAPAK